MSGRLPVCLFARAPRPGEVKTRLAAAIGAEAAARVAAALLGDAVEVVERCPSLRVVWACTEAAEPERWLGHPVELWLQGPGGLSERIERVLSRGIGVDGGALAVGPDTLGMAAEDLEAAARAVRRGAAALGPAADGGFWCLGLPRVPAGLLQGVAWSTARTGAQVAERLAAAGMEVVSLPERSDLDEVADLARFAREPAWQVANPRTWREVCRGSDGGGGVETGAPKSW